MNFPDWVYIVGVVVINVILILLISIIIFKQKESDEQIQKEVFKDNNEKKITPNTNMQEVYDAMKEHSQNSNKVEAFETEQEQNAIISYQELLKFKQEQEKKEIPVNIEEKKFPKTEIISPIYGRMENINEDNHELEKTLNIEPIKKEIKETEEFLKALKEFRKNL